MKPIDRIARAIDTLLTPQGAQMSLKELAAQACYEPAHFQKLFKAHVGISPKRLSQIVQAHHVAELLIEGLARDDAAAHVALSGASRLHDVVVRVMGLSPGQIKTRGQGLTITYGFAPTILGAVMIGKTQKGICWLGFLIDQQPDVPLQRMQDWWPRANFVHDDRAIAADAQAINTLWRGGDGKFSLDLYGTNFQIQVWQALMQIPVGATATYQAIAHVVGKPKAARAVGSAVGANPVSLLVPCHRVIQTSGLIGDYAWGPARKRLILQQEMLPSHT
ncbi:MAG: methylated-DNA--[protein]-cysteine S-methyltransferase [Alphaproteobacteria bacterium]|nr:methylated-DNA--[protein]-cysteine S-methyltransferase [Alphaproteobacteria bacterium]